MEDRSGCSLVACPACGALRAADSSCEADFHTLLGWEHEFPAYGEVHHLLVLCYQLQHPHLYSIEGLVHAKGLIVDFLEGGKTTEQVRREKRGIVASSARTWKVTARPGSCGAYAHPIKWSMTVLDVAADDHTRYRENVRRWADATLKDLREAEEVQPFRMRRSR